MDKEEEYIKEVEKELEETMLIELDKIEKIEDKEERITKADFLYKLHLILKNFKELEPVLERFFEYKHRRDKIKESKEVEK